MIAFIMTMRYLRRRKITLFAVLGVIFGAMAFIVVMGVMDGYSAEYNMRSRNLIGDVIVSIPQFAIRGADVKAETIASSPKVEAVSTHVRDYGILKIPQDSAVTGSSFAIEWCLVVGIEPEKEFKVVHPKLVPPLKDMVFPKSTGEEPPDWIILGADLMEAHNLKVGDKVLLVTSRQSGLERVKTKRELTIIGSLSFGISESDREIAYVDRRTAISMREYPADCASEIVVRLKPGVELEDGVKAVAASLGPEKKVRELYQIVTFQQTSHMFEAIESQRSLSRFILFFLFLVSGLSIIAVVFLIVLQKRHDIGVLRSIGLSSSGVAGIFLTYAGVVAVVGSTAGILLGWGILAHLDDLRNVIRAHTGFDLFPSNLYHLDKIPWVIEPMNPIMIFAVSLIISLLAGAVPAMWAAKLNPIESLRSE